jgi:hypothetical protein
MGKGRSAEMLAGDVPDQGSLSPDTSPRHDESPENWKPRLGPTHALLSPAQLRAAHLLHERALLSIPELARRGYEQWGYSNVHSATVALYRLFRRYDYPPRSRAEANRLLAESETARCAGETIYGRPCRRSAMIGLRFCPYHRTDETERAAR